MSTLYERLGPKTLQALVNQFYDNISNSSIQDLFQSDMNVVRDKQYKFLTQFLGGPSLYSNEYGHPKMRMRHFPHAIDEDAAKEWLKCMKNAIDLTIEDPQLAEDLFKAFPKLAAHMINR